MADKYKLLPSQVLEQASTLDLYIMNTANGYKNRQELLRQNGNGLPTPHLSKEQMEAMIAGVKQER